MPHHLWCCLNQPQYSPLEISHHSLLSGSIYNIQLLLLIVKISEEFYFVPTKCVFLTWLWSTGRDCLGTPAGRAPGRWWSQTTRHHLSPSETCRLWQGEYDQTQVFEGEKIKKRSLAPICEGDCTDESLETACMWTTTPFPLSHHQNSNAGKERKTTTSNKLE